MNLPTIKERKRFRSPTVTPQALAWEGKQLWISSRDLGFLYKVRAGLAPTTVSTASIDAMEIVDEVDPPGIVWAAVFTNDGWRVTIGKGLNDDRYVYRYDGNGRFEKLFPCPDLTGSYLSFDGANLYLSQWYEKRILKYDNSGNIVRRIDIGAEICGHTFVDGMIYVLRGVEKPNEDWRIARLDPREEIPKIKDLAVVPFACRSLAFDGENFWTNYRAADTIVSFAPPQ
jgi:sugar lactone lactonase YvrE